jgi:4,5:9,10-diseco-3-hydroxy-5,9,17-trioxoandrosta-1(10),2-diene-4-oate hydrolase
MTTQTKLPSRYIEADAGKLHYHEAGTGPAVILLHGGGPGAYGFSNFRRNVDALALRYRVIVLDLPGYGGSESRPAPQGLFDPMARALGDLMDGIGLQRASLVGNSLGGGTAIRFALDQPSRVQRLVLMGPGGSLPMTSTFPTEGLMRMLKFYDGEGPTLEKLRRVIDLLVFDPAGISEELIAERFKAATLPQTLSNPPLRGRGWNPKDDLWREPLYTLDHPTLILWGREDRVLPLDAAFLLLKTLPRAELHVFPRCGHWAQWEKAEEFNELVGNFLARP